MSRRRTGAAVSPLYTRPSDEVPAVGEGDRFDHAVHSELMKDVLDVVAYGGDADAKSSGDFEGTGATCQQGEHFILSWRQRARRRV